MASLANHVLGLRKQQIKHQGGIRKSTASAGAGQQDIVPTQGEDKQWHSAWTYIMYQVKAGKYTVCEEWLLASNFKRWFDENRCPNGIVTQLYDVQRYPTHFSPETTCIVPKTVSALVSRTGNTKRHGMRGVNFKPRVKTEMAYFAMCWDLEKKRALPIASDSELDAHLKWATAHVARIREIMGTLTKESTRAVIERFCASMEEDIAASRPMRVFEGE